MPSKTEITPREIDPEEILTFFRDGRFYSINATKGVDLKKQAEDNALANPGITRVEDKHGDVLWVLQ